MEEIIDINGINYRLHVDKSTDTYIIFDLISQLKNNLKIINVKKFLHKHNAKFIYGTIDVIIVFDKSNLENLIKDVESLSK